MLGNFKGSNASLMYTNDTTISNQIVQGTNNVANLQKSDTKNGIQGNASNSEVLTWVVVGFIVIYLMKRG